MERQKTPLAKPALITGLGILFIIGACISEYYSAGVAFRTAYPVKSTGESMAGELMSLRFPIIFGLLAGSIFLQLIPSRLRRVMDAITNTLGAWAIVALLVGMSFFALCTILLTLADGAAQGFATSVIGLALGCSALGLFVTSFAFIDVMMGRIFSALSVIADGLRQRLRIRAGDKLIRTVEADRVKVEALHNIVTEMEKPDALMRKAANEAGMATGKVIAEAHDLVASAKLRGDAPLGPDDVSAVPADVPLAALEERYAEIKQYTSTYFFNVLKNSKES